MADSARVRVSAIECGLNARVINGIITNVMGQRMASITQDPDLRHSIGEEYIRVVTPYVPMKTGRLRASGSATSDGRVIWSATRRRGGFNYALTQYTTQYSHYTTPGTGPYWTQNVNPGTDDWAVFTDAIAPLIIRRFRDG